MTAHLFEVPLTAERGDFTERSIWQDCRILQIVSAPEIIQRNAVSRSVRQVIPISYVAKIRLHFGGISPAGEGLSV